MGESSSAAKRTLFLDEAGLVVEEVDLLVERSVDSVALLEEAFL